MPQPLTTAASASRARTRVLLVEADAASARVATAAVATAGGEVVATVSQTVPETALAEADVAVLDLPGQQAIGLVDRLVERGVTVVATSGAGSVALAVEAMRRGAVDFILKPYTPNTLARRLAPRFSEIASRATAASAADQPKLNDAGADFASFVGTSAAMRRVYSEIERIAPSRAPVFVTGESGSGKELCAEAIHARSGRARKPFVALNCGAIPRELMESEVFGHVRGAFTGASEDRPGAVEAAQGGTLFLDEIGEMELALQAKLLRVLQTGEFRRVGEARTRQADIRIVCATHRDPQAEVLSGRFRQDLFYRLHVLPLRLPALRDRGADVEALASAFLERFSAEEGRSFRRIAPEAMDLMLAYDWPGNVRELQNVLRRAVVLGGGEELTADMLPAEIAVGTAALHACDVPDPARIEPFWITERRIIEAAVAAFGGNTARAAAALEISPSTIYRKRERWAETGS